MEFLGFEAGYFNVELGKRKPCRTGLSIQKKPGKNLYGGVVRLSPFDDVDGAFCKGLLNYVKKRNAQKYFQ